MWKVISLENGEFSALVVNTTYLTDFALKQGNTTKCKYCCINSCLVWLINLRICSFTYQFGEFGTYVMNIVSLQDCPEVIIHSNPANIYLRKYNFSSFLFLGFLISNSYFSPLALLWTALIIILMLIAWGFKCIIQQNAVCCVPLSSWFTSMNTSEYQEDLIASDSLNSLGDQIIRHRISSLDAFRGYRSFLSSPWWPVKNPLLFLDSQLHPWFLLTMVEEATGFWSILLGMASLQQMWFSHGINWYFIYTGFFVSNRILLLVTIIKNLLLCFRIINKSLHIFQNQRIKALKKIAFSICKVRLDNGSELCPISEFSATPCVKQEENFWQDCSSLCHDLSARIDAQFFGQQ